MQLLLILSIALLPTIIWAFVEAAGEYRRSEAAFKNSVLTTSLTTTDEIENIFVRADESLSSIVTDLKPTSRNQIDCATLIEQAQAATPHSPFIGLFTADGQELCSTATVVRNLTQDDTWLKKAIEKGSIIIDGPFPAFDRSGDVVVGALHVSDMRSQRGNETLVFALAFNQKMLDRIRTELDLPDYAELGIVDSNGHWVLGSVGNHNGRIPAIVGNGKKGDVQKIRSPNGSTNYVARAQLLESPLFVAVSFPDTEIVWPAMRDMVVSLSVPVLLTAMALVVVWLAADRLILRWTKRLRAVATAIRRGMLDIKPRDFDRAPREFQQLGTTFETMARSLSRREQELREGMQQRDRLIREIHHRVKNNLQIITSLLNIHSRTAKTESERDIYREICARVNALTLVHTSLYEDDNLDQIEVAPFISSLTQQIETTFKKPKTRISLHISADSFTLDADEIIPLSQFVTEALSNAFKHAFAGHSEGDIWLTLKRAPTDDITLTIRDNGIGLSLDEESRGKSMGFRLMTALARQLNGEVEFGGTEDGFQLAMQFSLHEKKQVA